MRVGGLRCAAVDDRVPHAALHGHRQAVVPHLREGEARGRDQRAGAEAHQPYSYTLLLLSDHGVGVVLLLDVGRAWTR